MQIQPRSRAVVMIMLPLLVIHCWYKKKAYLSIFLYPSYRKVRLVVHHSRKTHLCTALRWKTVHSAPAREVFQVSLGEKGSYYWVSDSLKV